MIHPVTSETAKSASSGSGSSSATKKSTPAANFYVHELKPLPLVQTNSGGAAASTPVISSSSVGAPTASPQAVASGTQGGSASPASPSVSGSTSTTNKLHVTSGSGSSGGGLLNTVLHGVIHGL
ncbi:MAG TPA: hypothetical protein VHA05_00775 [Candidatus Saccharimonadales bacterium]|nr:hypothetical protein [Candidatus Saccharimonadales bacterium]